MGRQVQTLQMPEVTIDNCDGEAKGGFRKGQAWHKVPRRLFLSKVFLFGALVFF